MSDQPNPTFREPDNYLRTALADLCDQYGIASVLYELGAKEAATFVSAVAPPVPAPPIHPPAHTRSRAGDPATSRAAARSLDPDRLGPVYRRILTILRGSEGLTDEDLHGRWTGPIVSMSGLRTRRAELVDAGLVRDSGRREKLRSGRQGIVWVVA